QVLRLLDEDLAIRAVPGRNLMPPPQLAGDAPGLDVPHPLEVGLLPVLGDELRTSILNRLDGLFRQLGGVHIPLVRQPRLDRNAGAISVRDHVRIRLDFFEQPLGLEIGNDALSRLEAVEPAVGLRRVLVDARLGVEDVDHRQIVPTANLEVVEVVRRGDLDRAGPLLRIGILIRNDRNLTPDQRQHHRLADEVLVAFVIGVNGNGRITEHRLWTGCSNDNIARRVVLQRIAKVPEVALHLDLNHLEVGDGRLEPRVPVDQPFVLVNEAALVEFDKDLEHRPAQPLVHRKALARPVARRPQPFELVDDHSAGLLFPLPDLLDELLTPEVAPLDLLLHELALDDHLSGNAGVIRARLPEHVLSPHALEAAEDILERVVERMPHMERAGDVRWRDDDAVGLSPYSIRPAGAESACVLPFLVDPLLDFGRLVGLLEHGSPGPDYKSRKVQGVLRPAFLTCQHKRACWGPQEVSPPK